MISKVANKHLEQVSGKPVYKVVRKEDDKLKSLWVEGTKGKPFYVNYDGRCLKTVTLIYEPNRVTSNGELGIWCCQTLKDARHQARHNGGRNLCKIYKVRPLGKASYPIPMWRDKGTILYHAIITDELIETIDYRGE